ncbi:MAG: hypothetical protein IPP47_14390, partial [Bryobacterales bacterium]|nr:hypothetical protein [Bryobacterales bacterium]
METENLVLPVPAPGVTPSHARLEMAVQLLLPPVTVRITSWGEVTPVPLPFAPKSSAVRFSEMVTEGAAPSTVKVKIDCLPPAATHTWNTPGVDPGWNCALALPLPSDCGAALTSVAALAGTTVQVTGTPERTLAKASVMLIDKGRGSRP